GAGAPQDHSHGGRGAPAVGCEVVVAQAGEAEDVAVEGLVVEVAPSAADAVAVVLGPALWGSRGVRSEQPAPPGGLSRGPPSSRPPSALREAVLLEWP
uniref:Uncharacterized protein n=1 Tax=Mustela putorius furo TaxID=9669 RepID=M3Y5Z9_MUSPF